MSKTADSKTVFGQQTLFLLFRNAPLYNSNIIANFRFLRKQAKVI